MMSQTPFPMIPIEHHLVTWPSKHISPDYTHLFLIFWSFLWPEKIQIFSEDSENRNSKRVPQGQDSRCPMPMGGTGADLVNDKLIIYLHTWFLHIVYQMIFFLYRIPTFYFLHFFNVRVSDIIHPLLRVYFPPTRSRDFTRVLL